MLNTVVSKDDDEFEKKPIINWHSMSKAERLQTIYNAYDFMSKHSSKLNSIDQNDRSYIEAKYILSFIPDKYRMNSIKEDLVLAAVEHMKHQYFQLFPKRSPLMLSPMNEVGIHKFISTYVKPTEFSYSELYYWDSLAKFLSHYITYEPLTKNELPDVVMSPTTTLHCQIGDSFDISLLLVSLLIGVGFDAYCVSGTAQKHITMNDQSRRDFPEEIEPEEKPKKEKKMVFKPSKYKAKHRPNMTSVFKAEDYEIKDESENNKPQETEAVAELTEEEKDAISPRIHCWILVLPGMRDIKEPFFIEPSTGELKEITDETYISIESVWNNENYWMNIFPEYQISRLSFDLKDLQKWEHIITQDKTEDDISRQKDDITALESGELDDEVLDLPVSWVGNLRINKIQFESKYPGREKAIRYRNALLELFTEYHMKDLAVKRITLYDSNDRNKVTEIHTYFEHRKDKLRKRSVYRTFNETSQDVYERIHEWFHSGRRFSSYIEGLKEVIVEKGSKIEFRFYHKARLDNLASRVELFDVRNVAVPHKVIHNFKGREDRLVYRSVTYELPRSSQSAQSFDSPNRFDHLTITKMTEKFSRDESKDANRDVWRRTFYVVEGRTRLDYHFGKGKIINSSRVYTDEGDFSAECVDPFMKIPSMVESVEEYNELVDARRDCTSLIFMSHIEIHKILMSRKEEEAALESVTTIYDNIRNRPTRKELEEMLKLERELELKKNKRDMLAPFIPLNGISSVEDAQEVYMKVIEDVQQQLTLRTTILKERNQKLQALFTRKKEQQKKNQDLNDNQEDIQQYFEDMNVAIRVTALRIEEQNIKNNQKWLEVKNEILNDPRLKKWLPHLSQINIPNPFSNTGN